MLQKKPSDLDRLIDKKCYTEIYNAVAQYIEDNPDKLETNRLSNLVEEPDGASLIDMEIIRTCDVIIEEDTIFFDAILNCEIEIEETVQRNREVDGVIQWFKVQCKAVLGETLKAFQVVKIEVYPK